MDKKEIILSFIVPVYNVEEYLEECLDSLVTQDIPYDEYEIICVDDGSTDKSGEILDVYAQKHKNIIVIHKENGGVSSARNCGIDTANGQYIWFVDADDFIKTNCLSAIKTKISENKYDTIRILPYSFAHSQNNLTPNNITPDMCQKNIKNFMITHIFKKQHVTINKIYFDTKISYAEDTVFMLQLNLFLRNTAKIEESVLYFYRRRPGSAMSQNNDKKINSRLNAALVCEEIIQGKKVGDVEKAIEFKYAFIVKTMEMLVKLPKAERKRIKRDLEKNKLFPLKYNSKHTPKSRKAKTSFVKKVRNSLIDISYTRFGYFLLSAFFATKGVLGKLK